MKRPYLDQNERWHIRFTTLYGEFALLDLRLQQLGRAICHQLRINRVLAALTRMLS